VKSEYADSVIKALSADVDCPNILCDIQLSEASYLRGEESWIIDATQKYEAWLETRKYAKMDRRIRKKSGELRVIHDQYSDLPFALDEWQRKWIARGSEYTAVSRDDMQISCNYLIENNRLKTISLYENENFAGIGVCVLDDNTAYHTFNVGMDAYREIYAGIRLELELIAWAFESKYQTLDLLRTSNMPKPQWADPKIIGHRLMRCPLGSELLGKILTTAKDKLHSFRSKKSEKLKEQSLLQASAVSD
jgi:hypothetical protein